MHKNNNPNEKIMKMIVSHEKLIDISNSSEKRSETPYTNTANDFSEL